MEKKLYVGITENGDASHDYSWYDKIDNSLFSVIISKRLTEELIEKLISKKDKIIFHLTCTGWGGTAMEPNAFDTNKTYNACMQLIKNGFPIRQIVLRVDPIILNDAGLDISANVLNTFHDSGIKRLRYSFIDYYPGIKKPLSEIGVTLPWETLHAPATEMKKFYDIQKKYPNYEYESCAEFNKHQLGCISTKDFSILGIASPPLTNANIRPGCLCCSLKTELLESQKHCPIGCKYCYRNLEIINKL